MKLREYCEARNIEYYGFTMDAVINEAYRRILLRDFKKTPISKIAEDRRLIVDPQEHRLFKNALQQGDYDEIENFIVKHLYMYRREFIVDILEYYMANSIES